MRTLAVEKKVIVDGDSGNLTEISDSGLPGVTPEEVRPEPASAMNWRERARRLQKEAHVFYFVFKDARTPWYAKLVALCTALYLFSPIQLIPNYIPVIGVLDDLLVVFLGAKLVEWISPPNVLAECRGLADAAEARRKEQIRSRASVFASVAVTAVWVLAAIVASVLMAAYFRH
jgi:uncharacterized membrane protein YkvA (DUF1232 family)